MKQEQVQKQKAHSRESIPEEATTDVTNEELSQAVDDTLEKIDDLLEDQLDLELLDDLDSLMGTEEEARAFVDEYRQLGGE